MRGSRSSRRWRGAELPHLRPLTADDLDEVVALQRAGAIVAMAEVFPQDTHPFPVERVHERWRREVADPAVDCFAVLDDAVIAGFAATRGAEFLHFGTAITTWGSGLAGSAHDEVVAHLRRQGHRRPRLWAFEGNRRARRFYTRRGWRETGEVRLSTFPPHPVLLQYALEEP